MNRLILIGRLGKDPEFKAFPSGKSLANLTVATQERKGTEKFTEWHKVVCFGELAGNCMKFLNKGDLVYVEGPVHSKSYQKKDGTTFHYTELLANNIQFLDTKSPKMPKVEDRPEQQDLKSLDLPSFADEDIPF